MVHAPHLPPKACSLRARHHVRILPWIVGMLVIALLAALITSLATVSWFYSQIIPSTTNVGTVRQVIDSNAVPDAILQRIANERVVTVYDATKKINQTAYTSDARLGQGILLSSDGWFVLYAPGIQRLAPASIEVVDGQGSVRQVEQVIAHTPTGLAYIQIQGEDLRIATLYDWSQGLGLRQAWVFGNKQWAQTAINERQHFQDSGTLIRLQDRVAPYTVAEDRAVGSLVFQGDGQVVGIVAENGDLLPGWIVQKHIPILLQESRLVELGLPYAGQFVETIVTEGRAEPVQGLYVMDKYT